MDAPVKGFRAASRSGLRPGKRAETKERNRRIILDAAREVFAERGYAAATVRDVIRATPLAPGTFYNYFKSKEELFEALREVSALSIRPALREARLAAQTPHDFVAGVFKGFFAYATENRETFAAITPSHTLHLRAKAPQIEAGFFELREDIEAAIGRGILPALDAEYLAAAMLGTAFELAEAMLKRENPDPDTTANFATALFIGGCSRAFAGT